MYKKMEMVALADAPAYSVDSPFILTGYRPQLSLAQCLGSMFRWHNQTLNIWTSVLLAAFNLGMTAAAQSSQPPMTLSFRAMFWLQGGLRAVCWCNSWAYHTFAPHSARVASLACRADYLGCYLTPLGMGSNLLFLELACRPVWRAAFLGLGAAGVLAAVAASLLPQYQTESFRHLRLLISAVSALPYLVGLVVAAAVVHRGTAPPYYLYLAYGAAIEALAGAFYVSMFPEVCFPRTFDLWLSSHTIWHCLNFGVDACMMALAVHAFRRVAREGCYPELE